MGVPSAQVRLGVHTSFAHLPRATSPPSPHDRFLSRLLSSTYKSLFPQLLSFLIYTKPPWCGGVRLQFFLRDLQDLPTFKTFQAISCVFMHLRSGERRVGKEFISCCLP